MHDPWTDRLSEYMDHELSAADTHALEEHLSSCDVCRATLAELRDVVAAARSLQDSEPGRDLWDDIAARIGGGPAHVAGVPPTAVTPLRRRFSFTAPQLAAAAVLLVAIPAGAVWTIARDGAVAAAAGTIVHAAGEPGPTRLVSAAPAPALTSTSTAYDSAVADLEHALEQSRDQLDPATVEVVERSIESIDRAIADARQALDADPGNPHLHRQLDSTMRRKVALLSRVTRGAS